MKKLIGLFVILFIITNVFGQSFIRDHSFIEKTPKGLTTIEDALIWENLPDNNFDWINYIHFVKDGKLFLLSYEPVENLDIIGFSRGIYLYSKDINNLNSPWKKASAVIMTNSYSSHSYSDVDFFLAKKSFGSVGNVEIKDDCIEITIGWSVMNKVRNDCVSSKLKYEFVPNGFGGYLHGRVYK